MLFYLFNIKLAFTLQKFVKIEINFYINILPAKKLFYTVVVLFIYADNDLCS